MALENRFDAVRPVLKISDLCVSAVSRNGHARIVKQVSFSVAPGEVLGFVGESGAGKSTLALAAMGFFRPGFEATSGRIELNGVDILAQPEATRRRLRGGSISYVAQSAQDAFNPFYTLQDQITHIARLKAGLTKAEAEVRARALFHKVGLPDPDNFGRKYPHQVSGGQLQRAMVCMAMITRPAVIAFDEPTTALDVTTQVEVLIAIRDVIREFGTAAIYISHDLAVIAQIADRVAVLRYGEVVETGKTADLIADPRHEYTKTLWSLHDVARSETTAQRTDKALLRASGVSAHYGKFLALKNINLEVNPGETFALVGESGSGKSTLGRLLIGLLRPSAGAVTFAGQPLPATVGARKVSQLKDIQMVFQSADTALNPRRKVGEIIGRSLSLYRGLRGAKRSAEVARILRLVELPAEFADRYPPQLSGGQKQRVAIARALAAEPRLVVCDEITSALDKVIQAEILRMLGRLQRELGVSFLFITHDLEVVRAIADRVAVMHRGSIVRQGTIGEVFNAPLEEYTATLLRSVPQMRVGWLNDLISERESASAAGSPELPEVGAGNGR